MIIDLLTSPSNSSQSPLPALRNLFVQQNSISYAALLKSLISKCSCVLATKLASLGIGYYMRRRQLYTALQLVIDVFSFMPIWAGAASARTC